MVLRGHVNGNNVEGAAQRAKHAVPDGVGQQITWTSISTRRKSVISDKEKSPPTPLMPSPLECHAEQPHTSTNPHLRGVQVHTLSC